ncbi:tail fiber domain-containing protein [Bradyrhizobium phage ppBeUSDA76-2]|uniref:tail fiber domain-containing protein n=1 Tax=Bradyrhizobium elkanii TaxID=29448 RepID=UPI000362BE2A|nr:tail fiber domain-containing protein [Bradyrhizobium elkanii]WAX24423.1 tail fiber domain-containing protein [Bradyrhizobium phage ppBeUSDA76-2]MCP1732419.1 hypothetical protein [Bradyrhizobium elkanii]MCS3567757.1 hypothetical protein [Bradyrhizobium elkanii]MCS3590760.1 hypothetical protein [Bradyrhizobium elkanii]MCS3620203.1 hypothetical protein [Bradyrhizobium elkanii]
MGGTSKSETTQSSTTAPWQPTQGLLSNIIGQLNSATGNTGLTGAQNNALGTIENNSNAISAQFGPQASNYAQSLFNGGGALNQAGNINQNYQNYVNATQPLASNTNYNPYSTPGFSDAVNTLTNDITNNVNGQFAASGRDMSGANSQALARGIAQGVAPLIQQQYNQNVANQQNAANALYGAGNTNSGLLAGLQQQYLTNQGNGVAAASSAGDLQNAGATNTLAAEAQKYGIPLQNLGLLSQIGIPIAGLGSQSSGQSTTTNQMSGAQQFGTIAGGLGSLFGGGGGSTVGNIFKLISDRNAKEDIAQVGTLFDGTPVYRYRYKGQPAFQIGLMAQDVEKTTPEAVGRIGAYKAVDYKLATDKALEVA